MGKKNERNTTWMYMLSMHAWLKYDLEVEHFYFFYIYIFFFMFHLYFVILLVDTSILQTGTLWWGMTSIGSFVYKPVLTWMSWYWWMLSSWNWVGKAWARFLPFYTTVNWRLKHNQVSHRYQAVERVLGGEWAAHCPFSWQYFPKTLLLDIHLVGSGMGFNSILRPRFIYV